jgi:uncharacterized membrane protein YcaP (DUF421 family)
MTNPEHGLIEGIAILLVYGGMNILHSYLDLKWPDFIGRKSISLIENGQILKKNLTKALISIDELFGQLRYQGAHNISQVAYATLEPTGKVSVTKKFEYSPLQRKTLNIQKKTYFSPIFSFMMGLWYMII